MRNWIHLAEGINTARIDHQAIQALSRSLPTTIRDVVASLKEKLPVKRDKSHEDYLHYLYDDIYQMVSEDRSLLLDPLLDAISKILTKITREYVTPLIPTLRGMEWLKPYGDSGLAEYVSSINVKVETREGSDDDYKHVNGYYSGFTKIIKVFVDEDAVFSAATDLISYYLFDEGSRELNNLLAAIIPTFVHEYAHLEQDMRKVTHGKDFGYITAGTKGRGGKGKRGGYMRTTATQAEYLRYKGNINEIDSFASSAVSELMMEMHLEEQNKRFYHDSVSDWNNRIGEIQKNLTYRYGTGSRTFEHYTDILRAAFDGEYADIGLNPDQMQKVWKRFAKVVSQKLNHYLRQENANPMDSLVDGKPFAAGIKSLAIAAAAKTKSDPYTKKDFVLKGYGLEDWEHFMREHYFRGEWDTPSLNKTQTIFRKLVAAYANLR